VRHDIVTLAVSAGGAATVYSDPLSGFIAGLYVENGDLDVGTDITITDAASGAPILTITNLAADAWYVPTVGAVDAAGAARLYAAGGTAIPALLPIDGALKFVVAAGGASKTGTVHVYVAPG
jgi:hypothetical protein